MPAIPKQSRYTQFIPGQTPRQALPPDAEENRQARWEEFRNKNHSSYPEFIAYEWLVNVKKLKPYKDFIPQYGLSGGRSFLGGQVIDIYFPHRQMGWLIQGLRYHHTTAKDRLEDTLAKMTLADKGIKPIEVFEDDIIQRTGYTLERAYRGIQVSRRNFR
jgi:hypothetical protein